MFTYKPILVALVLLATWATIAPATYGKACSISGPNDTIVIKYGKTQKIVITANSQAEIDSLRKLDLNALLAGIDITDKDGKTAFKMTLKDSSQTIETISDNDDDDDDEKEDDDDGKVPNSGRVTRRTTYVTVSPYLEQQERKLIRKTYVYGSDTSNLSVVVDTVNKPDSHVGVTRYIHFETVENNIDNKPKPKKRKWSAVTQFDFGLNNYTENGKFPDAENKPYGLSPLGSRHFGFYFLTNIPLNKTKKAGNWTLSPGLGMAWDNYMLSEKTTLYRTDQGVEFRPFADGTLPVEKSKFTVCNLRAPLTLNYSYKKLNVGAGFFAGYRLTSYTKVVYNQGGEKKSKDFDPFFINNIEYGITFDVGINRVRFFVNYRLNPLFRNDKGPDLVPFSFGVRL